jgi:hypothetical protein
MTCRDAAACTVTGAAVNTAVTSGDGPRVLPVAGGPAGTRDVPGRTPTATAIPAAAASTRVPPAACRARLFQADVEILMAPTSVVAVITWSDEELRRTPTSA